MTLRSRRQRSVLGFDIGSLLATIFVFVVPIVFAQSDRSKDTERKRETDTNKVPTRSDETSKKEAPDPADILREGEKGITAEPVDTTTIAVARSNWYIRPDPKERRRRYTKSIVGPVAIGRYVMVAGILTGRNAPSEWGGTWDGFGRRFASNLGESAIKNTIRYGLDEVMKVDSHFYLSRNRSVSARARNAAFSAVISRNRSGKRVIGIPKIAGHFVSNIASAELWYPPRYTYRHGLKGAGVSLAVDAGINLFREFVWKK
jgi:hypothetical protein